MPPEDRTARAGRVGWPAEVRAFFAGELRALELTPEQIAEQDPAQLRASLRRVDDAMAHPQSFGTATVPLTPQRRNVFRRGAETEIAALGILPLLLESKALIEERLAEEAEPWLPELGLDAMVKALGLIGIAAFGMLFVAYYRFYSAIGVRPEDIGVTYAYVLARSIGLALIVLAAIAYVVAGILSQGIRRWRRWPRAPKSVVRHLIGAVGPIGFSAGVFALVRDDGVRSASNTAASVLLIALGAVLTVGWLGGRLPVRLAAASIVTTVPLAFAVGLAVHAHNLGAGVRAGGTVDPLTVLGAPLLDVQARAVVVEWVGPAAQRPANVFGAEARLCATDLGRSQSTQFLMTEDRADGPPAVRLVQLPVGMVSVRELARAACWDLPAED